MKKLFIFLILLIILPYRPMFAQAPVANLTGRVLDAKTGQGVPFATVYLNNSSHGTNADENGVYRLTNVPLGNQELVGSMLGYQTIRQPLRLTDVRPRTIDFKLEPTDQSLAGVTVTARHNQTWVRQFRTFSRELLGNKPQSRQCRITNPNGLSFGEEKGHLLARAVEPLVIENGALGYRLHYNLLHFDLYRGKMQFAGTVRFEELPAANPRQQAQWQANRLKAYQGSLQHLLASLLTGTHEQAGYQVYRTPLSGQGINQVLPLVRTTERNQIGSPQAQALFKPGELPFERRLVSDQPLEVYYNRVYASNSPYRDSPYAYSMLLLPKGIVELTTNGWITQSNGLDVRGFLGNDRLATLLPADWAPIDGEMLLAGSVLAGRVGTPDARLDSLVVQREREAQRTAPPVFVHTDKAQYAAGDQLWLSAYVLDAARQLPIAGLSGSTLQVELVAPTGQSVQHQWLSLTDGRAASNFRLADTLASGIYRLRAYTAMDHSSNGPAFTGSFTVYNARRPDFSNPVSRRDNALTPTVDNRSQPPLPDSLDVQFLPEGGRWLVGVAGRLGIKAVGPDGRGRTIRGQIVDQTGAAVAPVQTNALGMGQVILTPQVGQRYTARVDRPAPATAQTVALPKPEAEGWAMTVDALSDSSRLTVRLKATGRFSQQPVYVTLQSREQFVYRQKWLLAKGEAQFSLATATLPPGVCRLTVWDTDNQPRAERLVFVPEREQTIHMRINLAKPRYASREQVSIGFQLRDGEGYPVVSSWSAAVTDADQLPADTSQTGLRTYLLLTAGLRGTIESPGYYLEPDHLADLDDLLLTQGWRRLPTPEPIDSTRGWTLSGRVMNSRGKPLGGQSVLVMLEQGELKMLRSETTDAQGRFRVGDLLMRDTVQVNARLVGDEPSGARITFDAPGGRYKAPGLTTPDWNGQQGWIAGASQRQASWPALYRDPTARQLAEVTVKAFKPAPERPKDVERSSLHGAADGVLIVDRAIAATITTFKDLLAKVPGITQLYARNFSSFGDRSPLLLLDGVYVNFAVLEDLNPTEVSRIELLKNPATAGIYGARAANGVIAVYTRKTGEDELTKPMLTAAKTLISGYTTPREFYVPRYELPEAAALTDRRDVLFWQPLGQSDADGLGRLTFPLSDTAKKLRVVLQGITADGQPMSFSWELPVR